MADIADHDSPWKEALEHHLPEFLALLFPLVHTGIDWSKNHLFLDKELQQVVREANSGRRYADKLVRVYTTDGEETWVLIHIEVQGEPEGDFAERMYRYNYRLFDRYGIDIVSLAVLADASVRFRPQTYERRRWGCQLSFRFPSAKLLDWLEPDRWRRLEQSDNIFSHVVMAQIRAKTTKDDNERKSWKYRLVRTLYERGYSREVILDLFRIIDWMVQLPEALEHQFLEQIQELEEERKMPFIAPAEQLWQKQGVQQGEGKILIRQIQRRYGQIPLWAKEKIAHAAEDQLEQWAENILDAATLEDVFR